MKTARGLKWNLHAGKIELEARIDEKAPPGTAVVDFGWGNSWDKAANINALVGDKERDPICCATSNRCFPCDVRRKDRILSRAVSCLLGASSDRVRRSPCHSQLTDFANVGYWTEGGW